MQKEQTCPICGKEQISEDKDQCPQCNADLTCFRILDSLPEYEFKKQGWEQRILLYALTVIILFIGGWMTYQNLQISRLLMKNKKGLEEYQLSVRSLLKQVESITIIKAEEQAGSEEITVETSSAAGDKKDLSEHQKDPWPEHLWYETTDRDTLWGISERFYKHGRYYPILIAMNPEIHIFEIKAGQRIKILKGLQDVSRIFNECVSKSGPFQYVWYTVMENDSLESIGKKFYKTEGQYPFIRKANPDLRLENGSKNQDLAT
jgi:hypothetical protein